MRTRQFSDEVLFADAETIKVERQYIDLLKAQAQGNKRQRMRLCAHSNTDDPLHEMLIVNFKHTYVRPHKQLNKTKSYHIIEGSFDVVLFDEGGNVVGVIQMSDYSSGKAFFHRFPAHHYHTLLIRSEVAVFQETTNGPFRRSDTIFAPWSPDESDSAATKKFMKQLERDVASLLSSGGG